MYNPNLLSQPTTEFHSNHEDPINLSQKKIIIKEYNSQGYGQSSGCTPLYLQEIFMLNLLEVVFLRF